MAQRFAANGTAVFLGGRIGTRLASLLDPKIKLQAHPSGAAWKDDEVHLILEYKKGARWGSLVAPRANRLILVHDVTNSRVLALEDFHKSLAANAGTQLLVVAGLHLLEGQVPDYRRKRLAQIVAQLQRIDRTVPVHFELASVGNRAYLAEASDHTFTLMFQFAHFFFLACWCHSESCGLHGTE